MSVLLYLKNKNQLVCDLLKKVLDIRFVIFVFIFIVTLFLSSSNGINEPLNMRYAENYCKWLAKSFFLIVIMSVFVEKFNKYFIYALWIGDIIISLSIVSNYFILGIDRPGAINMLHPNMAAGFIIMLLPFVLVINGYKAYFLRVVIFIISSVALFITGSRGAMLAYLMMLLIFTYFHKEIILSLLRKKSKYIVSGILILCFSLCGLINLNSSYNQRIAEIFKYHDNLIEHRVGGDRILLWESSLKMIEDKPFFGVGLKSFNDAYIKGNYIDPRAKEPELESPHNIFLHFGVETGLLGSFSFLLLITYQLYYTYKNSIGNDLPFAYFLAIIGMVVHGMVDYLFMVKAYYQFYWFLCGAVWVYIAKVKVSKM